MNTSTIDLHNIDVKDFFKTVDTCKGDIYLETVEGDILNLKSKLCQLIGITSLIEGGVISEVKIRCSNPDDERLLFRYGLYREVPESK